MNARRAPLLASMLLPVLALGLAGCQFGEYTMYADCDDLSEEVSDVIHEKLGIEPEIEEFWAGESQYWCSFAVATALDLDVAEAARLEVKDLINDLLEEDGAGIFFRVTYVDQSDLFSTGLGPGY